MNERIKELAREAGLLAHNPEGVPTKLETFAELIVKECIQVCKNEAAWDPAGLPYKPSEQFHDAMKQHFGVEE